MRIVAFITDLMDRSKIEHLGDVVFARDPSQAVGADVVVIDLAKHADAVPLVRAAAPGARIIAFGRHTDARALRQASKDGADAALPRSTFLTDPAAAIAPEGRGQTSGQG